MTIQYNTDAKAIDALANETLNAIRREKKVRKHLSKAKRLFTKASEYSRNLIAIKFIFPISQLLAMNYGWGSEYLNLFPQQLKAEHCMQINSSSIYSESYMTEVI